MILRASHVRADSEAHRQVGVDDSLADYVPNSRLTTVRFDNHRRGRTAFEHAIPLDPVNNPVVAIRIPGTLVERASVAPVGL